MKLHLESIFWSFSLLPWTKRLIQAFDSDQSSFLSTNLGLFFRNYVIVLALHLLPLLALFPNNLLGIVWVSIGFYSLALACLKQLSHKWLVFTKLVK